MVLLKFFKNPEIMIHIQFSLYLNHIQTCIFLYFVLQKQYLCVCICSYHHVLLRVNVLFVLLPFSSCACSPPYEETALLKRFTSFFISSRNQSVSNYFLLFRAFRGGKPAGKGFVFPSQVLTQDMLLLLRNGKCNLK